MNLHLPAIIERLTEQNTAGACYLQLIPVDHIETMPTEIRGTISDPIVPKTGKNFITLYPTRWTQDFREDQEDGSGARYSRASLAAVVPKDRVSLLYGLWQMHHGRFVVLHYDLNKTVKVIGTLKEPAQVRMVQLQHGQRPGQGRNQYILEVSVARRTPCPFYLAEPPEVIDPAVCAPAILTVNGTLMQVIPAGTPFDLQVRLNGVNSGSGGAGVWNIEVPTALCDVIESALDANPTVGIRLTRATTTAVIPQTGILNGRPTGSLSNWAGTGFTATYQWTGTQWLVSDGVTIYSSSEDVPSPADVTAWTGGPPTITVTHSGPMLLTSCLTPTQQADLVEALVQQQAWAALEAMLTPPQLAAAIESLGGSGGGSLCDAIEAALASTGDEGIIYSHDDTEGFVGRTGSSNGRPHYSSNDWPGTGWSGDLYYTGTVWYLTDGVNEWTAPDVPTPDLATWSGPSPLPSVTLTGGSPSVSILLDCLTSEQAQALFVHQLAGQDWSEIQDALSSEQLDAAEEALAPTLCQAVDATLNSPDTAGVLLTIGSTTAFVPQNAIANGRPRYLLGSWPGTGFTLDLLWTGSQWYLSDSVNEWTSDENVAMAHMVVTWDGPAAVSMVVQGPLHPLVLLDCLTDPQKAAIGGTVQLLDENDDPVGAPIAVPAGGAITWPVPINECPTLCAQISDPETTAAQIGDCVRSSGKQAVVLANMVPVVDEASVVAQVYNVMTTAQQSRIRDLWRYIKFLWQAGDADTVLWTVTADEAGVWATFSQTGTNGTLTYSLNGGGYVALSGTIVLTVGNTITVRRTTTTNAGTVRWAP